MNNAVPPTGFLSLIFTAHVPYLRAPGPRPDGEDALHETIAFSLIPLLNTLNDLREDGFRPQVGVMWSPVLLEQLADPVVQKHFGFWIDDWIERAEAGLARANERHAEHDAYLARFFVDWSRDIRTSFADRYGRNLVAALRVLCADGIVEPLASPATYAALPLLQSTPALRSQLDMGLLATTQRLGQPSRGLWLPDYAYDAALLEQLALIGTSYTIGDSFVAQDDEQAHLQPRWLADDIAAFATAEATLEQVWSTELGYPGDPLYLSARRDTHSGIGYWRNGNGHEHAPYDPYHAFRRTAEHATHFCSLVAAELDQFHHTHGRPGVAVVPLDALLIGQHWFEGNAWLRSLLATVFAHPRIALATPTAFLDAFAPRRTGALCESTLPTVDEWSASEQQVLEALHAAEERLTKLVRQFPNATDNRERVLAQAVREILLAQSSDWLRQGANVQSALERLMQHVRRCERLCEFAERPALDENALAFLDAVEELDNPFPNLNYRVFAA